MIASSAPPSRATTRASQALWQAMEANGDLYLDRYEGWYSVRDEAYYDESELIEGEGGEKLSPQGTPVEWTVEESWFFRLSKLPATRCWRSTATTRTSSRPESRRNEVLRFVEGGPARPVGLAHQLRLGRARCPAAEDHVMYVWVDALTNYLTGLGFPDETADFAQVLAGRPAPDRQGHRPLPRGLLAGLPDERRAAAAQGRCSATASCSTAAQKESKSLGNVTDPLELADRFGVDHAALFPAARGQPSGRTAAIRPKRSSPAPMPSWPTASATWRSARCR